MLDEWILQYASGSCNNRFCPIVDYTYKFVVASFDCLRFHLTKFFLVAGSLIIRFALSRCRADIFIFHVFFQRCRLCAFRVQEVLEETRGTERDYHGNRGNRTEIRQRSTNHTRGVPPADVKSGSSHVGTIISDLPKRRGATRT